jgi:RimJ/RimL family protein N-acetyltransferase
MFDCDVVRPYYNGGGAALRSKRYGVEQCGLPRVMATIAPENLASRRVAEKAGMLFDREEIDPEDGPPMLVYYFSKGQK